jgi:hypothetical protein
MPPFGVTGMVACIGRRRSVGHDDCRWYVVRVGDEFAEGRCQSHVPSHIVETERMSTPGARTKWSPVFANSSLKNDAARGGRSVAAKHSSPVVVEYR